jgi:hypothetical protein
VPSSMSLDWSITASPIFGFGVPECLYRDWVLGRPVDYALNLLFASAAKRPVSIKWLTIKGVAWA